MPVDDARLTSKFGWREHPIFKTRKFHYGLDLAAPIGTPVRAAADGFVAMAGVNGNYGNYVRIDHGSHLATGYVHLSSIVSTLRPGTRVAQGEIIGFVGMSGLATGAHLRFQLLQDDKQLNPLTSRPIIEEEVMQQLATNPRLHPADRDYRRASITRVTLHDTNGRGAGEALSMAPSREGPYETVLFGEEHARIMRMIPEKSSWPLPAATKRP